MTKRIRPRSMLRPEARIPKGVALARVIAALPKLAGDDAADRDSAVKELRYLESISVFGERVKYETLIREALLAPEIDGRVILERVATLYEAACLRNALPCPPAADQDPNSHQSEAVEQVYDDWMLEAVCKDILANCGAAGIVILPMLERMLRDESKHNCLANGAIKAMLAIGEPACTITDALLESAFKFHVSSDCLKFIGKYGLSDDQLEFVKLSVDSCVDREVFAALYILRTLGERATSAEPAVRRRANAYVDRNALEGFDEELRDLARTTLDAMDGNPNEAARRWLPQLDWGNDPEAY